MVCLYHGDYGPADPAFTIAEHSWTVGANRLAGACNAAEAAAIQRHVLHGETVSWCDQGYAWAEQDAVGWFYAAALLFVVLPYLVRKVRRRFAGIAARPGASAPHGSAR